MNILLNQTTQIIIQNSLFENNTALEGGAIFITQIKGNIYFQNSTFSNNSAYANGGAILFDTILCISFDQNTKILFNSALIGGGIRIRGVQEFNLINDGQIFNNKAEIYGENIATYPSLLQIELFSQVNNQFKFDNSNFTNNRQIYIQDFQSGGSLDIYLFFMDNEGKHLNFSVNSFKQGLYPKVIENEIQQFNAHLDLFNKSSIQIIGASSVNYNQYNETTKSFTFQSIIINSIPFTTQQIILEYSLADYVQQSQILMQINFRKCQRGEIDHILSDQIRICVPCNIGQYSMYEYSQNSYVSDIECQKCPEESLICNKDNFVLKQGYWRQSNTSNIIIQCTKYQEACNEQEFNNLFGCVQGYVGPLCEQCDYSGSIWQRRYSENSISTSCQECSSMSYQIVAIVISSLIILIYLFLQVIFIVSNLYTYQSCYYIRMMNLLPISVSQFKLINTFYIKCLLSYLQLQVFLVDQINKISLSINFIPSTLAQPSSFTVIDALCIVSPETLDKNGPGKTKLIISQIYNLILGAIIICLIIFVEKIKFNKINFKKYLRYNVFYLLYTFMQPDALRLLSKFLTCRKIGDNSYFTEDLQILCNQSDYKLFQYYFGIPLLVFWIVFPAIIFVQICKRSKNLNISSTIFRYGYFFIEYKKNKYYWEFVRMYLKVQIVIFFTLFNGNQKFSYMVAVVFIVLYISYLNNSDPFLNQRMKKLELLSLFNLIALICFQIVLSIYNQQPAIKIIMILLHFSFISYVIWIILYRQLLTKRNILGRTFLCVIQKILSQKMFDKIQRHTEVSMKVYQNWKKIRNNLKYYIDLHTINKMNQTISQKENQTHINLIHPRHRLESNFCCQTPILNHQEISIFERICSTPNGNIIQPINSQLSPTNLLLNKNYDSQNKQSLFNQQSKQQEDINQNNQVTSGKQDDIFIINSEMSSQHQDQAPRFQDKFRFQKNNQLNTGKLVNNLKQ
ncbi:transmembrane protein, putative (macronuclear) [Tetrahymena thermophila SB210]|uniref:Transmembrane protein, putative n=1 Tax=Tetrahymena thermophila (strain SB210) TaxID=312017 RepID=Q22Z85_TETTS|nr:transmembrane protein, putative [Tetrahymena thermophila SB210]EAR90436.2 transmembrane protein, putative [Tetrahymena thermophila SB210]|eukprot:XP_001010681.2 transmembrane protein, putative [Tetrahymena thermophila SB210]